jgi:hypothetical protein
MLIMEIQLTNNADVALKVEDNIAPAMNMASLAFNNMRFLMGSKEVCATSNDVAEVSMLKHRLNMSRSWLESVGRETNFMHSTFTERRNQVISDGYSLLPGLAPQFEGYLSWGTVVDNTADTIVYANANSRFTLTDNAGADLVITLAVGDYIYATVNGITKIVRVTAQAGLTFDVDYDFGDNADPQGGGLNWNFFNITKILNVDAIDKGRQVSRFKLAWRPCLSIFDYNGGIPGGISCRLIMNPHPLNVFRKNMIESIVANKVDGAGNDFRLEIKDLYLKRCVCKGERVDDDSFYLDLEEIRCQRNQLTTRSTLLTREVAASTNAITIAFQDQAATTNTLFSRTTFKVRDDVELALERYYIEYGGLKEPRDDGNFGGVTGGLGYQEYSSVGPVLGKDIMVEFYNRNLIDIGAMYDNGGAENLREWRQRGIYLYHPFLRDGSSRSTVCKILYSFNNTAYTALGNNQPVLLLFNHYTKAVQINIRNGKLAELSVNET